MWSWFVQWLLGYAREEDDGEEELSPREGVERGGDCRPDKVISFGYSLLRGKRSTMEDFHHAKFEKCHGVDDLVGMFGVFDGHGGPDAAMYVKANLFNNLKNHKDFTSNIDKATKDIYVSTNESYLDDPTSKRDDGSTAVTAVVLGKKLSVANVGDSRAVLCRRGKAIQLSIDHKPNDINEKQRIEDLGGMVIWAGTWRVGGVLAVSRAFGDRPLKKFVKADPSLRSENITSADEFLILASDGLWDVLTNERAVSIAREALRQHHQSPRKAAEILANTALCNGSNDNISCIIVKFNFP